EHALEDMRERIFTEAKQKAEELLPAVAAALAQAEGWLEPPERERIQAAEAEVRAALAAGDAARLKGAVTELDRATEALAARLVEQAMEESLRRRGVLP